MKSKRVVFLVLTLMLLLFGFMEVNAASESAFDNDFNWVKTACDENGVLCHSFEAKPYKDFNIEGVTFRITATGDGDGSVVAHSSYGKGGTSCITVLSGKWNANVQNFKTVERVTIKRADGKPWLLNSLWADKQEIQPRIITFTGSLNGTTVVTKTCNGMNQTLNFGNAIIDTLTITSEDFYDEYFTIDNLKGNTEATLNEKPTAANFTASPIFENTAYDFNTSQFGYADGDSNPLDHLKITSVPASGSLWIDSDNNDSINGSEAALTNGSTISKASLDAGKLKYINTNGNSSSFTFKVNDGTDDSEASYTATLQVTSEPRVTLSLEPNSTVNENGGTTNIKAILSETHNKKVTVNLAFSGTASSSDYSASSSIEIEAGQTSGTVTITGTDDTIYEGEEGIIIDIDSVTNGKESGTQQVTCNITDDDSKPLITLQVDKTQLTENPENCIVTVTKQGATTKDITVNLSISGTSIAADYNLVDNPITILASETKKTTTLSSLQDVLDEDNETVIIDIASVTNGKENGTQQKTVTILDDDDPPTASLSLENSPLAEDGGKATLKATLSVASGKDIIVGLGYTGTASNNDYTANTTDITIAAGDTEGSLMITGKDDDIDEDTETIIIDIDTVTNATENGIQTATAEITDDDTASLNITESDGSSSVNESGTMDTFTVALASKPITNVVLNVASIDKDEVDVDKTTLTFTEDNWNVAQTVTLIGKDDNLVDGNQNIQVNITVDDDQSDNKYDGLSGNISVTTQDDDVAGFTIIETDGNTSVSEDETTDTFTVKLDAQPETNVVIKIINGDTTEKSISHDSLTFTKDNWNAEQTVTVTGVNDDTKDGEQSTDITLSIDQTNTDDTFDSVASKKISVTTIDNDVPNLIITEDSGKTSVIEGSTVKDKIAFRLSTQPVGGNDVNITLTPTDTSEISLWETSITILNADWNKNHNVTVASVDDIELDGDITSNINITTTSSDSDYNGLAKTVKVITVDDESVDMSIASDNKPVNNGSTAPTVENHTDFGSVDIHTQTVTKTYTIKNTGNYELRLTNTPRVTITGDSGFSVESQPEAIIAGGASTTFTIKFDPSTTGEKTVTVSIANTDTDNNPYTFKVKGTGTEDIDAPTVTNLSPSNGGTSIAISSNLEIIFNENIKKGTGYIKIYKSSDDSLVESISANDVSINEKIVTINPTNDFAHGTKYYVKIDSRGLTDETGNDYTGISDKITWSFTTQSKSSSSSGGSSSNSSNNVSVEVNGKKEGSLGKAKTKYEGGKKVITVSIDEKKLEEKLEKERTGSTVTIPVGGQKGSVVGQLNGQMVKNMEEKEAIVEIKTEKATYTLPADQINIDKISEELGEGIDLEDIDVEVKIGETSKDMVKVVENTAKKDALTLVVPPVDFEVTCSYESKKVSASKFNAYVERTIALPKGIEPNKVTTGIVVYLDGTTCHVPTKIVKIDGKYYAKINSLTNSTYSVVWNPKNYSDVENHWSKDICNEMGARMVVEEESENTFNPDQQITRLFFTETVVKALGLGDKGNNATFTDMAKTDEGFGYVATSVEYELIEGYPDRTFRPDNSITREAAATLILRAMKLAGMKVDYTDEELQNELNQFVDKADIHDWAKKPIAICAKNGLIVGNNQNQFLPKANITKAELAMIMKRMLEKAGLI
jgi:hypothetical protein